MKYCVCTNCGFTADTGEFTDEDEFWSCPICSMDESGIELIEWSLTGATVQAGVYWPEQNLEGKWFASTTVTDEEGELLPFGSGIRFRRTMFNEELFHDVDYYVTLQNWDQVAYVRIIAIPIAFHLDIPDAIVQNT